VNTDIAIIGSGFAGSLMAMIARKLGFSVLLIERGNHPRFAIGESSTPLANLLLEEIARKYSLPALLPLCKWGSWQRSYPGIACGLKRGFTFLHHLHGSQFVADRRHELLVAASPCDEIADTHWYRPDFDAFLVGQAQALGVDYMDNARACLTSVDNGVALEVIRAGSRHTVHAEFLVDASGPRGFMHQALGLTDDGFPTMPKTQALFAHFSGVQKWDAAKAKIAADVDNLKARVASKKRAIDARIAASDADDAEDDPRWAIDYAIASIEQAKFAVFSAISARLDANQAARVA